MMMMIMIIQSEMNKNFSPDSEDFTLEKIIEYGFDSYADKINEISGAASKELLIETGLADIARTWEDIELDMSSHKDKGHYKIKYVPPVRACFVAISLIYAAVNFDILKVILVF